MFIYNFYNKHPRTITYRFYNKRYKLFKIYDPLTIKSVIKY